MVWRCIACLHCIHLQRRINLDLAVEEAVSCALKDQQWHPELAIVFISSAYVAEYDQLISELRAAVPSLKYIVGSSVGVKFAVHIRNK